jgi:hypothetical protein
MVVGAIRRFFLTGSGAAVAGSAAGGTPSGAPGSVVVGAGVGTAELVLESAARFNTPPLDVRGPGPGNETVDTAGDADGRAGVREVG